MTNLKFEAVFAREVEKNFFLVFFYFRIFVNLCFQINQHSDGFIRNKHNSLYLWFSSYCLCDIYFCRYRLIRTKYQINLKV